MNQPNEIPNAMNPYSTEKAVVSLDGPPDATLPFEPKEYIGLSGHSPRLSDDPEFTQLLRRVEGAEAILTLHTENKANPHDVTSKQLNLGSALEELQRLRWAEANRTEYTQSLRRLAVVLGIIVIVVTAIFTWKVNDPDATSTIANYSITSLLVLLTIWLTA